MNDETKRRRALTRNNKQSKSSGAVLFDLNKLRNTERTDSPMSVKPRYAYSKRLAGRGITVGTTAFKFNKDGVCKFVYDFRRSSLDDFNLLLKQAGVERGDILAESPPAPLPPVPPPTEGVFCTSCGGIQEHNWYCATEKPEYPVEDPIVGLEEVPVLEDKETGALYSHVVLTEEVKTDNPPKAPKKRKNKAAKKENE